MKKNRFKEEFITTLNIEKKDFIKKFSGKFEHSEIDFFSEFFKSLNSKKKTKTLIGKIESNKFKLKRNTTMNSFNYATAIAKGKISDSKNGIIIKTEISGFDYKCIPLYIVLGIVFVIPLIGIFGDFQFIIGLFFSSGIFLYTRNNMLKDVKKLKLELTKKFEINKNDLQHRV